jgi:hypothetical protein
MRKNTKIVESQANPIDARPAFCVIGVPAPAVATGVAGTGVAGTGKGPAEVGVATGAEGTTGFEGILIL